MKTAAYLFILIIHITIFPIRASAQHFGFLLGYSTSEAIIVGGHLINDNILYRFSVSFEISDARGKEVTEQQPNYGRTIDGTGDYFTTYDFSVGYYITEQITLCGELSFGQKKYYTSYLDNRFSDGGYHMIDRKESLVGFGINGGYIFKGGWGFWAGYHTVRKLSFGVNYDF
jgi:hypothetical protein